MKIGILRLVAEFVRKRPPLKKKWVPIGG